MKKFILAISLVSICGLFNSNVMASEAIEQFKLMKSLRGAWKLAPASTQEGKATKNKAVAPLVGTDKVAIDFKVIGKGSTVQENLLPGTKKEMATMYHCDSSKNCQSVQAKHYCAKKNQPQLVAEELSKNNELVMNCDMNTGLCNSKAGHVHQIKHTLLSKNHLKTTYTIFKDGKLKKNSTYHFERLN